MYTSFSFPIPYKIITFIAFVAAMLCQACRAATDADMEVVPVRYVPVRAAANRGLERTISGVLLLKPVSVRDDRILMLDVPGFRATMPVHAVIQPGKAPLVVLLPGICGKADTDFSRIWPAWFSAAGYHVLTFNSTFRPEFIDIAGHGVSGNVWNETEKVSGIISAFLKRPEIQGNVSELGIVGMSYGGVEALILGQMQTEGRLSFKIDAIQAYSPPIKIERTAEMLDTWFNEDRWNYTLIQLANSFTPKKVEHSAYSPGMMRAAVAASFHSEMPAVVIKNNDAFGLNLLPKGNDFDDKQVRQDWAETWGFQKYAYDLAIPWWEQHGNVNANTLIGATHLCELLKHQPSSTAVIIAEDDPFDYADDMAELRDCAAKGQVSFLPDGGHLGYVADEQTRERLVAIFIESSAAKEKR